MNEFSVDRFVESVRTAAASTNAASAVQQLMHGVFADVDGVDRGVPAYEDDEVLLFEDDSVSIWYCRFDAGLHVPPHEHRVNAYIGVFRGEEDNLFYKRSGDRLDHVNTRTARRGDVLALGHDAIHSVRNTGTQPSHGLHVYLGPLSRIDRELFDIAGGQALPFTEKNYDRLKSFAD